jgi:hypothetical protein
MMSIRLKSVDLESQLQIEITNSEYRCSALIGQFEPDFVVIDSEMGSSKTREIAGLILNDSRIPFVEVLVAGDHQSSGSLSDICGRICRPFSIRDLGDQISAVWYDRLARECALQMRGIQKE